MKIAKLFGLVLISSLMLLTACSKDTSGTENTDIEESDTFHESGMPIVDDPITLEFMTGKTSATADNYNELLVWEEYNEMTNIDIDWGLVQSDSLEEKRNLALSSGDVPDVFYSAKVPNSDLLKYGKQGLFIELDDLIEEYMPNLTELLEETPDLRAGMTFPDGHIYSLPTIHDPDYLEVRLGMMFWIREDWLDELEMDPPETTDDFYEYLKAVKNTDLLGDGSGNEIPYGAHDLSGLKDVLKGSFGIGNKGHQSPYVDLDPETDEPRFFPISDEYKEMVEYMHKLFDEELIEQNILTIETNQSFSNGAEGLYGSVVIASPHGIYGNEGKNFIGMNALKGPHGDQQVTRVGAPLNSIGGFVITNENEYIPETLRWMDHFYGDEGAKLYFLGVEGETYTEDEDGELNYVDEFYDDSDGLSFDQTVAKYLSWLGGGYPGIVKEGIFKGNSEDPASKEAADRVRSSVEEVWPHMLYTSEENEVMSTTGGDIEKYTNEMFDKFVTGEEPLDKWDKYVDEIENMGLDEYMDTFTKAYERFEDN